MRWRLVLAVLTGLLALDQAQPAAAAKLYISEYKSITTIGSLTGQIAPEPGLDQTPVDFSGGAAQSAAFAGSTRIVRLICDASCSVVFGASPQTATTSNKLLPANMPEYFGVIPGQVISVRSNP